MTFEPGKDYVDIEFKESDFRQYDLTETMFENCIFIDCVFSGMAFKRTRFLDCTFQGCDLANVNLSNAKFTDPKFKSCKLLGLNWSLTEEIRSPSFFSSNLSLGSFRAITLKNLKMTECRVHEADFQELDLTSADFSQTDLQGTLFNNCNLAKADLRTARNYTIDPRTNKLAGAKFSLPEAVGLLQGFGIILD